MLHDGLSAFLACSRENREEEQARVARNWPSSALSTPADDLVPLSELRGPAAMTPDELEAALSALERRGLVRLLRRGGLVNVRLTTAGLGFLTASRPLN